jgi:acetyl-CoA/propionyl-CoA carboxylase biotin carboxyl carrier protein
MAHGPDRATALRRLDGALGRTAVLGVTTNTGFLRRLLELPEVVSGTLDTGLIERHLDEEEHVEERPHPGPGVLATSATDTAVVRRAAALLCQTALGNATGGALREEDGLFAAPSAWRLGGQPAWTTYLMRLSGQEPRRIRLRPSRPELLDRSGFQTFEVCDGDARTTVTVSRAVEEDGKILVVEAGITTGFFHATDRNGVHWLAAEGECWAVHVLDPLQRTATASGSPSSELLLAPMPGVVTLLKATVGEAVIAGQTLLILEAMKMEHRIAAPHAGTVTRLPVRVGSQVAMDELLAVVDAPEVPESETPTARTDSGARR